MSERFPRPGREGGGAVQHAPSRARRWWIPGAVLVLAGSFLVWNWGAREAMTQGKVLATAATCVIALSLLLLWAFTLAGISWPGRLRLLGALVGVGMVGVGLVEVRGYTGDLAPILGWRLAPRGEGGLPAVAPRIEGPAGRRGPDFPQFLGVGRDATVRGVELARDWGSRPPRLVWRRELGAGWSGFAVAGDLAFTQEQRGESEAVVAYELATGEVRWVHADEARFESSLAGPGPRATPTVHGDRVVTLGATGILNCLERGTGALLWSTNVLADTGAANVDWGLSGSPLVVDGLVVVSAGGEDGGSLVAHDLESGERVWSGGSDRAGYSSPALVELAGARQILVLNGGSVASHDPLDGRVLWEVPWSARNPNVAQPVPLPGDRVLVSSGYGVGCALYRIARGPDGGLAATRLWRNRALKAKFANFVHRDGFVYGLDDGILVCLDVETGRRAWKGGRYGHGQMLLVGELLLVTAEFGNVVLVEATPGEHRELTSFRALDGKTWNSPALAAPYLLVRNDVEAACYELPLATMFHTAAPVPDSPRRR